MVDDQKRRSLIFGGSFDPVHRGHLEMVKCVFTETEVDEVIVMPCFQSPFKSGTVASGAQRAEMIRLGLRDENIQGASVSAFEIERDRPSYSWETAEHFAERFPENEWYWLVGTDQWDAIDRWAKPEVLRERLSFVIMTRNGAEVQERPGWRYRAVPFAHPASSTQIRGDFAEHQDWLTPSVRDYCAAEELYQETVEKR